MKRIFYKILSLGTHKASKKDRQLIRMSNSIALIECLLLFLLALTQALLFKQFRLPHIITFTLFILPLILNSLHLTTISRLTQCWGVSMLLFQYAIFNYQYSDIQFYDNYSSVRIYLLGFSVIPYFIFNTNNKLLLLLAILPGAIAMFYCEPIWHWLSNSDYPTNKLITRAEYTFQGIRFYISYLIIQICTFGMRVYIDKENKINHNLLENIKSKKKTIQQNAKSELKQKNEELENTIKKLIDTETTYQQLFDQATEIITIGDLEGNLLDVNPSMCRILGYSKEELIGKNIKQFIDPETLINSPLRLNEIIGEGLQLHSERILISRSNEKIYMEVNAKAYDNKIMVIARPINERKKLEKEKDESKRLLQRKYNELITLFKISRILNQQETSIPLALGEIVNLIPQTWQRQESCNATIVIHDQSFTSHNDTENEISFEIPIRINAKIIGALTIGYSPNKFTYSDSEDFFNTLVDMIQLFLVHTDNLEQLTQTRANLQATINNTDNLIWTLDQNLNVVTFNSAFALFFKYHYDAIVVKGKRIKELRSDEPYKVLATQWEYLYNQILSGDRIRFDEEFGDFTYSFNLSPIVEENKIVGVCAYGFDITERKNQINKLAEANRKIGDLKVMALKSTINPHFLFNVLNSIQYYIANNDRVNAINFLSKFSKLIRLVLNQSLMDLNSLSSEMEMLNYYLELEKLRMEDHFEYKIQVDPELDLDSSFIPPLMIQPFVENSILHGFSSINYKGMLSISFHKENEFLKVRVEDNGIGRKAASISKNKISHKSIGTKIIEERLMHLNEGSDISINYIDLSDRPGTIVEISIKMSSV